MTVTLPDGTELKLEEGATEGDAALAIGEGLARVALAISVKVRGQVFPRAFPCISHAFSKRSVPSPRLSQQRCGLPVGAGAVSTSIR